MPDECPRVLINNEAVGLASSDSIARLLGLRLPEEGFRFNKPDNYRDVFIQGSCDRGTRLLAKKLGWLSELDELRETSKRQMQEKLAKEGKTLVVGTEEKGDPEEEMKKSKDSKESKESKEITENKKPSKDPKTGSPAADLENLKKPSPAACKKEPRTGSPTSAEKPSSSKSPSKSPAPTEDSENPNASN